MTLSASALIEMLREQPELVVELKKVAAGRLNAQGIPTQEDSITDEMLYGRIATDAALRSAITVWLRARGGTSRPIVSLGSSPILLKETRVRQEVNISPRWMRCCRQTVKLRLHGRAPSSATRKTPRPRGLGDSPKQQLRHLLLPSHTSYRHSLGRKRMIPRRAQLTAPPFTLQLTSLA